MIRLSSSRRFDMKSCLLHRVTKVAKLQLGPITVMKVVRQHNNTNSRKDKKRKRLHLSPLLLLLLPSLLPTAPNSRKRKRMEIQIYITRFAPSSPSPSSPGPCHPTLFQTDRIAVLAIPDIQLHRPEERADRSRVFLVRMRDYEFFLLL